MSETKSATLSLKSLLVPSKSVEVEYPGLNGFKINVVFLSRETLVSIRKKSTKTTFKNRQPVEELDDKLFLQLYVNACIKGWSGLKMSYLEQLAPVDMSGQDPEAELAYDQDNALALMQSSANFDAFISETVTELSNFTKTSTSK
jgi:hypothetical protein